MLQGKAPPAKGTEPGLPGAVIRPVAIGLPGQR